MSNRYFVRTVNHNTLHEHFVVADFRREGACVNVFFNRPAALDSARRLNRDHHQRQLECLNASPPVDSPSPLPSSLAKVLAEAAEGSQSLDPASNSRYDLGDSWGSTSTLTSTRFGKTPKQVMENFRKQRLVK